jgi:hypothetical protein
MIATYGGRDPADFLAEVREKARERERKAARMMIGGLRRVAGDLRAMGQLERSLEALDRGVALVPAEARGPIDEMRAQLLRELSSRGTSVGPGPEGPAVAPGPAPRGTP